VRWKIVILQFDHDCTPSEIYGHLTSGLPEGEEDISMATIYEVLRIFEETNDVMTPGGGHRVNVGSISGRAWSLIESNLNEDPTLYLDEICDLVASAFGESIPPNTLCQSLRRRNYTRRVLKQLSIKRHIEDEKNWATMVASSPASYFAFIDYTHKNCRKLHRRSGYGQRGARRRLKSRGRGGGSHHALQLFLQPAREGSVDRGASWTLVSLKGMPMETWCAQWPITR